MHEDIFSGLPRKIEISSVEPDSSDGDKTKKGDLNLNGIAEEGRDYSYDSRQLAVDILGTSEVTEKVKTNEHFPIEPAIDEIYDIDAYIKPWIQRCLEIAETADCDEIADALAELDVRWQFPGFRLAFVGEFSRGKSTLINRLLQRDLLPVSARPTTGMLISITNGSSEKLEISTSKGWVTKPINTSSWQELLAIDTEERQQELTQVRLTINNPWLRTIDTELIDTPGAGDLNSDRTTLLSDVLSRCDAAIVLVSATLPVSLTEAAFLEQEILGRHVSNVLVAVSKLDTVEPVEQDGLLSVVRDRVAAISSEIPVEPIPPIEPDFIPDSPKGLQTDALAIIREKIEVMVARGHRRLWRSRKVAMQLLDHLTQITSLCDLAIKSARMSAAERERALIQAQQETAEMSLEWENIRLEIEHRRLYRSERLREKVMHSKTEMIENYMFALEEVSDLKSWWERELPFQLRRELLNLGTELSRDVLTELDKDFDWVQNEVVRIFSREVSQQDTGLPIGVKLNLDLSQLQLTDVRQYALLTRLASSATTVCGYVFGGPVGVVVSAAAWVFSDQFIHKKVQAQRQLLSKELVHNLERVADEYCTQVSNRLKWLYAQLIDEITKEQVLWQSARQSVLEKDDDSDDFANARYFHLNEQALALKHEITTALSA
mgnify:CR=1 FL=1